MALHFRVIMKAAKRRLRLPALATEDIVDFDKSEHATYTEDEANSLTPIGSARLPQRCSIDLPAEAMAVFKWHVQTRIERGAGRSPSAASAARSTTSRGAHAVEALIKRSISAHTTERMQEHDSTYQGGEQRAGIARVISLFGGGALQD